MRNLLKETTGFLAECGKSVDDVKWCGSEDFGWFTWPDFVALADKEYDDGYGSPKVCQDLQVVGTDWWLERHEYDGSEWWELKEHPKRPAEYRLPTAVVDDGFMWVSLKEANPTAAPTKKGI
jgi:hypothetical protein